MRGAAAKGDGGLCFLFHPSTPRPSSGLLRGVDRLGNMILHVATGLHLGAREFVTFDTSQRRLASAQKLKVKP